MGISWLLFFPGDEIGNYNLYHFIEGLNCLKLNSRGSMSEKIILPEHIGYLVFQNLVFHTPVLAWIKNGIAQKGLQVPKVLFHKIAAD